MEIKFLTHGQVAEYENQLFEMLVLGDNEFVPPLSSRSSTTQSDLSVTEVIKKIGSWSNVPIVVVSARSEDHDKVMALDAGADDYVTKPFSVEELLARLRVMGRRYSASKHVDKSESVFKNGDLEIDFASNCVYVDGIEVHLTPIEYKILCLLSHNFGKVLTHTDITKVIWGNSWESTVITLRTFMASLRRKIEHGKSCEYIHTHTGVGYRMICK